MAKVINNTLSLLVERWDDPGDYPSGAGSGPLASYDYIAGLEGEILFELTDDEFVQLQEADELEAQGMVKELVTKYLLPSGVDYVAKWDFVFTADGHLKVWQEDGEVLGTAPEKDNYYDYEDYDGGLL